MFVIYPVGDGRLCWEVGEVGDCPDLPLTDPTVPTLSFAFSISTTPPPFEAAAMAAVVKYSLKLGYQKYRIVGAQVSELVVTNQISFLLMLWDSDGVFTFNILIELYHFYRVKLSLFSDHSSLNCIGCLINKHFWIKVLFSTFTLTGKLLITKYECLHHLAH